MANKMARIVWASAILIPLHEARRKGLDRPVRFNRRDMLSAILPIARCLFLLPPRQRSAAVPYRQESEAGA
ncbi:hypothetical protein BA011_26640 (plasmid) [Rhizobium leguminosarum]|uniref:Uncharacterized protein n=1 Tax=Rhizobium leguminosarum TaxID=384 RepID=A0A1B1CHV6_RHILE|nr:hypothetical protein BA011_26640 [Rhizobium leguminosarum]